MSNLAPTVTPTPKTHPSTWRRFLHYLQPYRRDIPQALGLVTLGAITQSIGPFLIGWSIDNLITQGNRRGLGLMLCLLVGIYF